MIQLRHFSNPSDPQAHVLSWHTADFLAVTRPERRLFQLEPALLPVPINLRQAVAKRGEIGLMIYHANASMTPVTRPEPPFRDQYAFLTRPRAEGGCGFPEDEVQYYFLARSVCQWNETPRRGVDFVTYMHDQCKTFDGAGVEFSLDLLNELHQKRFGQPPKYNDRKFWLSLIWPAHDVHARNNASNEPVSRISQVLVDFRDDYIVGAGLNFWQRGLDVLAVYGEPHAVNQAPRLFNGIRKMSPDAKYRDLEINIQLEAVWNQRYRMHPSEWKQLFDSPDHSRSIAERSTKTILHGMRSAALGLPGTPRMPRIEYVVLRQLFTDCAAQSTSTIVRLENRLDWFNDCAAGPGLVPAIEDKELRDALDTLSTLGLCRSDDGWEYSLTTDGIRYCDRLMSDADLQPVASSRLTRAMELELDLR